MKLDDQLFPCPFCGSTAVKYLPALGRWAVRCVDCQAWGPETDTTADARAAWNQRHDLAQDMRDAIEHLARALDETTETIMADVRTVGAEAEAKFRERRERMRAEHKARVEEMNRRF